MSSPAELLLSEMRTKLDGQLATLESARTRVAVLLSVSGVIAGLFAQNLKGHIGGWGVAALVAFVVGGIPAIWILGPHKMTLSPKADGWIDYAQQQFDFVKGQMSEEHPDPTATGDIGAAELANVMLPSMQIWYSSNAPILRWVNRGMAISAAAVVVQMICWGVAAA
jgi:hypothetical protein